jgi:N-acetylmuramoyl-L-alanine amidase
MARATAPASAPVELRAKPIVVAVDAGHGGDDPGAHGPHGLLEKDVTLSVARKLAHLIDAQPGMRAVLTRDSDTYVGLRERTEKARDAQADLFVSVHCNALRDPHMRGTAVYVLSDHGATNEQARWLANRENAADMVGGVDLHDKDNQVAAVLIDISQTATMEASFDLGNRMLDSLGRVNVLQKPHVQQAGFMVLKSPDIPSVLVETAFITNTHEERLLGDGSYQDKLASSLLNGIRGYFSHYRPQQQIVADNDPPSDRAHAIPVSMASAKESASAGGLRNSSLRGD